jgi:hypothetical protein
MSDPQGPGEIPADATPTEALELPDNQPVAAAAPAPQAAAPKANHTRTILEIVGGVVAAGLILVAGGVGFAIGHATDDGPRFADGGRILQNGPQADGPQGFGQRGEGPQGFGQRGEGPQGFGQRGEGPRGFGQRGGGPGGFGPHGHDDGGMMGQRGEDQDGDSMMGQRGEDQDGDNWSGGPGSQFTTPSAPASPSGL